jgi:hypothetical protein
LPEIKPAKGWTIEHELTKANSKTSRADKGITVWGLLLLAMAGDKQAAGLFREYALVTKGRNQLVWSRGFRKRLEMDTIEETIQDSEQADNYLFDMTRQLWFDLVRGGLRGELLHVVKSTNGDLRKIEEWLMKHAPGAFDINENEFNSGTEK